MRHLRWQALIAVLGMLLVIGLLFGQGRSTAYTTVPASGGTYTEALVGAPARLNPLLDRANPADRDIDRLLFSGLTRFDALGRPQPDLASWLISDDGLTYTFVLRGSAVWHDGTPVTAADVAFTVSLLQAPDYPGPADVGRLWQSVQVRVVNAQTLEFKLPEPFAPFLDYTTLGILPQHLLTGTPAGALPAADFNTRPVGSGPFAFDSFLLDGERVKGVALKAFPDYYGPRPLLNRIEFYFYPDTAAAFAAYQAGSVLGVSRLGAGEMPTALSQPALGLYTALLPEYSLIFMNERSDDLPFFKEKKVRQALLTGLNRQAMVANLLGGQAVVATGPVLPGSWAYNSSLTAVAYDPEAAVSLLEAAGWTLPEGAVAGTDTYVRQKNGVPLRFTLLTPDDAVHQAIAAQAQANWAQIGVRADVASVAAATLLSDYLQPRAYQAVLADLNLAGTPDPDPYPLWHETQAESGQNYSGYADRITSEILEQARLATDLNQRAELYRKFQSRFSDQTPALLLFYPVYNYAVDAKVNGVQVGPLTEPSDRFSTLGQWYLVTRRVIVQQAGGELVATPTP
jgi:peptide/nickel transport system substrate-binding protein